MKIKYIINAYISSYCEVSYKLTHRSGNSVSNQTISHWFNRCFTNSTTQV